MKVERPEFGAEKEVAQYILSNWIDRRVAGWVIRNYPLIELGGAVPPVPIYTLDFEKGLTHEGNQQELVDFKRTPKFVMSGGFEGHIGHFRALNVMEETRILTCKNYLRVLLLEPDSYIRSAKHREPITKLGQRTELWATSGKVDAVVLLPERTEEVGLHYENIDRLIQPAEWFASVENPHWREIVTRPLRNSIDLAQIVEHRQEMHSSFLASTKSMDVYTVLEKLRTYSYELAVLQVQEIPDFILPREMVANLLFQRFSEGLVDVN